MASVFLPWSQSTRLIFKTSQVEHEMITQ